MSQLSVGEHLVVVAAAALGRRRSDDGLQERLAHGDLDACAETHLVSFVEEGEAPAFFGVRRRGAGEMWPVVVVEDLMGVVWTAVLGFDHPRPTWLWPWNRK